MDQTILKLPIKWELHKWLWQDMKRLILRKLILGIADGILKADGKSIYEVKDMKVGLFSSQQ